MGPAEWADWRREVFKVKNGKSLKQDFLGIGIGGAYWALRGGKRAGFQQCRPGGARGHLERSLAGVSETPAWL